MREPGSHSCAAMRISAPSGILTQQGNRAMTKIFAIAASIMMLVAISGQASARATASNAQYGPEATVFSDQQAARAFNAYNAYNYDAYNAFDPAMPMVAPNTHRYEGGPKTND
jgi:hypothetical protein